MWYTVTFTGEETEKEFLEKCLKQWDLTVDNGASEDIKLMQLGAMFSEMRHRVKEIEWERKLSEYTTKEMLKLSLLKKI